MPKLLVIHGAGRTFMAGSDIKEFDAPQKEPVLGDVLDEIEAGSKPVVAAIHGTALGGGLELAMACHYRIATSDASVGQPEVTLGLTPGAGATITMRGQPATLAGAAFISTDEG